MCVLRIANFFGLLALIFSSRLLASDLLPAPPMLVTKIEQCTTFSQACYAAVDERRLAYQSCTSGHDASDGTFRNVHFPACPDRAYAAYAPPACDSSAEYYECGLASCRASIAECQEKASAFQLKGEDGQGDGIDLYDELFKSGKKWHDVQLKARNVSTQDKAVIGKIVEKNFETISNRHRAMLDELEATKRSFASISAVPRSRVERLAPEPDPSPIQRSPRQYEDPAPSTALGSPKEPESVYASNAQISWLVGTYSGETVNNRPHGFGVYTSSTFNQVDKGDWKDGKRTGVHKHYMDGNLSEVVEYIDGKKQGRAVRYATSAPRGDFGVALGAPVETGYYVDHKRDGEWIRYMAYKDGAAWVSSKATYVSGTKVGEEEFDQPGSKSGSSGMSALGSFVGQLLGAYTEAEARKRNAYSPPPTRIEPSSDSSSYSSKSPTSDRGRQECNSLEIADDCERQVGRMGDAFGSCVHETEVRRGCWKPNTGPVSTTQ